MCKLVPAPGHSPLFVYLSHSGVLKPVLKRQFISVLYARLKATKVPQYHMNVVPRSTMNTNGGTEN